MNLEKPKYLTKAIGIGGYIISIILLFYFSEFIPHLSNFSEKYFIKDHQIGPGGVYAVKMIYLTAIVLIIILSTLCIFNLGIIRKTQGVLSSFINIENATNFFLKDELCNKNQLTNYLFIIGTSLGILVHLYLLTFGQPSWEGSLEEYISFLFFISAILLIISSFNLKKNLYTPKTRKKLLFYLIAVAGVFLFIYGEEISWGQRLFGIESPEFFEEYNTQTETNFHNFFNPLFLFAYPVLGIGMFILLFLIWVFPNKKKSYLFYLFLPHPSFFYLVFILACASFLGENEIYEELLAMFVFLYSFRILMCIRFPKNDLLSQEKSSNQ